MGGCHLALLNNDGSKPSLVYIYIYIYKLLEILNHKSMGPFSTTTRHLMIHGYQTEIMTSEIFVFLTLQILNEQTLAYMHTKQLSQCASIAFRKLPVESCAFMWPLYAAGG